MNLLQFCLRIPFPPIDGGSIAMYNLSEALYTNGVAVDVFSLNTKKHFISASDVDADYRQRYNLITSSIDTDVKWYMALLNLFTSDSYNIIRFYSDETAERLKQVLKKKQFDVIQLESIFVSQYIPLIQKYSNAKIVLRAHNIENIIWHRLAHGEKNLLKKSYLGLLARRLKAYENEMIHHHDAILAITPEDANSFKEMGYNNPISIVPLGIHKSKYERIEWNDDSAIFHVGSMDWLPNNEGIAWFLNDIYPLLLSRCPEVQVYLAGKGMPDSMLKKSNSQLHVFSLVEDPIVFAKDKSIMIAPLLSGGGMRVKIIEAMAMGKAIVSTRVGAEGIECTHGKDILLADDEESFALALLQLIKDADLRKKLSSNARILAFEKYDNNVIGKSLLEFYTKLTA